MRQWKQIGAVAPGGTVFAIAQDDNERVWLATEAGLFFQQAEGWLALPHGQPLQQLSAMTCVGRTVFAGSSQGQIVYSNDTGRSWYEGNISQSDKPVSWLIASPNFERDRVLLAGTDGAGVLRSTDGGRNWRLTNFGLRDFTIITLAVAPAWGGREVVFAATLEGFYRSPNGGRAWKRADAGLEGLGVQAIVLSPRFAEDKTLFVGTESGGIFRSTDQGHSWQPFNEGLATAEGTPPINALWLHPDFETTPVLLAGSADGQMFRSTDGGVRWQRVANDWVVLCLAGSSDRLYAGLYEHGLLTSTDGGQSWSHVADLAARPLTRLLVQGDQLLAYGPWDNVWRSTDGGTTWQQAADVESARPLFTLAVVKADKWANEVWLLGTNEGLLRSTDGGATWAVVLDTQHGQVATICLSPDRLGQVWVGTSSGALLTSADGGQSWQALNAPQPGLPVLELALLPTAAAGQPTQAAHLLVVATLNPTTGQVILWMSDPQKITWTQWLQATANWPSVYMTTVGAAPERVVAAIDRRGWRISAAGWERVLDTQRPIGQLLRSGVNGLLVLTGQQLLRSTNNGGEWAAFDEGLANCVLQDMALAADGQTVYVLSTGGLMWRRNDDE